MIKAPYNFVPVSKMVFFPLWSDDVSHDIPFRNGESGVIEVEITALSPIFISDSENETEFCQANGTYYIPGSSLKGMIRNVLEIMSFSKMNFVDDKTFSVRDLQNAELYRNKFKSQNIYAGWLRKTAKGYIIEDSGHPGRISHKEIDKVLGKDFSNKFSKRGFGGSEEEKTAKYKYDLAGGKLTHKFRYLKKNNQGQEVYGHANINAKNEEQLKEGTLVFTGQPTPRENTGKKGDGKGFEFIFFDVIDILPITDEQFEKFKFAYFDGRKTQPKESKDWTYWKEKLEKGERVPVFFRKNEKGEVEDFGLSMLYKLPYKHSIHDGLPPLHREIAKIADLSETIFGFIDNDNNALKGRVFIGHASATTPAQRDETKILILGTPRASYYPNYIEQKENQTYKTYMDDDFCIRGWKRYPIHRDNNPQINNEIASTSVTTTFTPLRRGVKFSTTIRYHNLKPEEIGALLSAITFHDTKECKHSIGLAKAYGFGKIAVDIKGGYSILPKENRVDFNQDILREYMAKFEEIMEGCIENWHCSDQIMELCTMASEQGTSRFLRYMDLADFAKEKATGNNPLKKDNFLNKYSSMEGIKPLCPQTLINKSKKYQCLGKSKEEIYKKDLEFVKKNITNDPDLLEKILKKYPEKEKEILREIQAPSTEELISRYKKIDWLFEAVMHSSKLSELKMFLERYPSYPKKDEIKAKIEQILQKEEEKKRLLQIKQEWENIADKDDIELLQNFIEKYPESQYAKEARNKIVKIEQKIKAEEERRKKEEEAKKKVEQQRKAMGAEFESLLKKKKKKK